MSSISTSACDHKQAYPKPTLSTLLQGLYRPAPTRREAGSFAILQAKTGRKSRTRENKLSVFVFNSLKGGNTYDGSVSNMAALLFCRKAESVRKEYGTGGFLLISEKTFEQQHQDRRNHRGGDEAAQRAVRKDVS